jgi:threonine dehydrogenase-like Zn-dependent dehydrogenase
VKAICWAGVNRLTVEDVPEPRILSPRDAILRVTASSVCGSDLHLIDGYLPFLREGDVIGHEFMGEVVETGSEVTKVRAGDRVVVGSFIGCGACFYCQQEQWSLCDNTNPQPLFMEKLWGYSIGGVYGYSHAGGGFPGSHAEYIRVPFADNNAFPVPENLSDEQALFASDALPTGWMGADMCHLEPGSVVAVWGCGAVGQMAARSAYLLGAERVIAIDRLPERLATAERHAGVETLNFEQVDVIDALRDMTGGRGPDACIEAVGMEADGTGLHYAYDRVKQAARMHTERITALRQAILACRKGGTVSIIGVFGGFADKFPLGAAMNKALVLRMGQQHGQRYIPMLLERISRGEIDPSYLATHQLPLDEGRRGYDMFKHKDEDCLRVVFRPGGAHIP